MNTIVFVKLMRNNMTESLISYVKPELRYEVYQTYPKFKVYNVYKIIQKVGHPKEFIYRTTYKRK